MLDLGTGLAAVKTVQELRGAIANGEFEDLLSEIELHAAREAMKKSSMARDTKSQTWTAISHLESAFEATMQSALKQSSNYLRILATGPQTQAEIALTLMKAEFICKLMALLYLSLDETHLAREQIQKVETLQGRIPKKTMIQGIGFITSFWGHPLGPSGIFLKNRKFIAQKQVVDRLVSSLEKGLWR